MEDSEKYTALSYASLNGHVEVAEFLIKIITKRHGKEEMTTFLNKPNKHGETSLFLAASKGHAQVVAFLLSLKETDVNAANLEDGASPLHVACLEGHLEVVKVRLFPFPTYAPAPHFKIMVGVIRKKRPKLKCRGFR